MINDSRVLIVDDQPMNRDILRKVLRREYLIEEASSGEECLEKVPIFQPQVILLDIMMPGLNGYEVCHRIKTVAEKHQPQVILVSGKGSTSERLKGYDCLADDYIVKPFDHEELRSKARLQLRLWTMQEELMQANAQLRSHSNLLERRVEERTKDLVAAQDITLFALAQLADSRDPETGAHLFRIRAYAQTIGRYLSHVPPYASEIDSIFLDNLFRSSPLHDIGKVGISDRILLKPGKLTPEEFREMQEHVVIGADTLEDARDHDGGGGEFLTMAAEIARYHHEKYDGTGYCEGRKGNEIPLSARIVALADVYDALTSKRVYKDAFDPMVARKIIQEGSGSHFDPGVVNAFEACFGEFLQIGSQFQEGAAETDARFLCRS